MSSLLLHVMARMVHDRVLFRLHQFALTNDAVGQQLFHMIERDGALHPCHLPQMRTFNHLHWLLEQEIRCVYKEQGYTGSL